MGFSKCTMGTGVVLGGEGFEPFGDLFRRGVTSLLLVGMFTL